MLATPYCPELGDPSQSDPTLPPTKVSSPSSSDGGPRLDSCLLGPGRPMVEDLLDGE